MTSKTTRACRLAVSSACALIAVVLISSSAFAQSDTPPKVDIFAGYQYLNPGATVPTPGNPSNPVPFKLPGEAKGIGTAVTYNFDSHWGLEGDLGYNRDTSSGSSEWTARRRTKVYRAPGNDSIFLACFGHLEPGQLRRRDRQPQWDRCDLRRRHGSYAHEDVFLAGIRSGLRLGAAQLCLFADPEFPSLRRPGFQGERLRTGIVMNWGGAPALVPAASCSVQPAEVLVGEPITATVTASNFNPKHTVTYGWSGNGGQVTGKDTTASIDTTGAAPGSYTVTAHVTDPKANKNNEASCSANYTVKPLPPKNPPTMSLSASPTNLVTGGSVNLSATCTSPDSVPVSVANWTSTCGYGLGQWQLGNPEHGWSLPPVR